MLDGLTLARVFALVIVGSLLTGKAHAGGTVVRLIDPQTTDPDVVGGTGDHLVALSDGRASGFLVLFFPGTGAAPDDYSILLEHLAEQGHHVIGLSYRNQSSINFVYCPGQTQTSCPEEVRTEILTGQDTSPLLEVNETNSAYGRLRRLLSYLSKTFPQEPWGGFLIDDDIAWDRIIVSGQSQGGGHAALSAKKHRVARAVLFSATEPAPWTSSSSATPQNAYFGIVHGFERNANGITSSWARLGLPGALTSIDELSPPYNDSQRLETERTDCNGDPDSNGFYHNCTSADDWLPAPTLGGEPAFAELWDQLFSMPSGPDDRVFRSRFEGQPDRN